MPVNTSRQIPSPRARRWTILAIVLPLIVILSGAGPPVIRRLRGQAGETGLEGLRYRFERTARGTVTAALESEIAFYQTRITRDPHGGLDLASLAGTYLRMARATGDLSWYVLADQAARRSLANLPFHNDGAVLVLAKVAEVRHDFKEAIRLAEGLRAHEESLGILVTAHLATGRVDAALLAAEELAGRLPTIGSLTLRALVNVARGADAAAEADFRRAIGAEESGEAGGSAYARTLLGRFHAARGRLTVARDLYQEALRILPEYPLALVLLAELDARVGAHQAAERHLSKVTTISADPTVFDHVVFRTMARLKTLQRDRAGANALWDHAEARLRRDVAEGAFGHRRELAHLWLERGHPDDRARALALMRVEAGVRRDAETLGVLAWALAANGRLAEARETLREALRSGIRDARLHYRAGMIEQALGNRTRAEAFFRSAAEIDPGLNAPARRALGLGL
jgi:tetratricopeptide (TPR) repeat protein